MRAQIPTEANEQAALFEWSEIAQLRWPELRLMHHIPNGGSRDPREAHNLKRQGVKAGVPDICLPVARGGYHGMYIELKRKKGWRLSGEQIEWVHDLNAEGYKAIVCMGWEQAKETIEKYLEERA